MQSISRRTVIGSLMSTFAASITGMSAGGSLQAQQKVQRTGGPKIRISLNAYSFNRLLRDGSMTLDDLLEFCAGENFDARCVFGHLRKLLS